MDWRKGCYMGQEVTARMKYRGLVKKRLLPLRLADGGGPPAGHGTGIVRGARSAAGSDSAEVANL